MKVNGQKINDLRFQHNGMKVAFRGILNYSKFPEDVFAGACIEFEDSHEIEELIGMLERFRDEIDHSYLPKWVERLQQL